MHNEKEHLIKNKASNVAPHKLKGHPHLSSKMTPAEIGKPVSNLLPGGKNYGGAVLTNGIFNTLIS